MFSVLVCSVLMLSSSRFGFLVLVGFVRVMSSKRNVSFFNMFDFLF